MKHKPCSPFVPLSPKKLVKYMIKTVWKQTFDDKKLYKVLYKKFLFVLHYRQKYLKLQF